MHYCFNLSTKLLNLKKFFQIDELKAEIKKLQETDEKKTSLIEELSEKLAKYGKQNSALLESLQETESSEKTLRDSLTRLASTHFLFELVW